MKRGIREAKPDYRRRIEDHLSRNNIRQVWQVVQHLISCRTNLRAAEGDPALAEKLNIFFARFKVTEPKTATLHHTAYSNVNLTIEEHEMRPTLRAANPRKMAGPDGIPGRVLKDQQGSTLSSWCRANNLLLNTSKTK